MSHAAIDTRAQEALLGRLLGLGTWTACALIIAGALFDLPAMSRYPLGAACAGIGLGKAGIAVLIFLPVARVALMLFLFLRERDYTYVAIAMLVLAIIVAGYFVAR
jgi:hypothetical protein